MVAEDCSSFAVKLALACSRSYRRASRAAICPCSCSLSCSPSFLSAAHAAADLPAEACTCGHDKLSQHKLSLLAGDALLTSPAEAETFGTTDKRNIAGLNSLHSTEVALALNAWCWHMLMPRLHVGTDSRHCIPKALFVQQHGCCVSRQSCSATLRCNLFKM